jgi:hypothetical protein
MPDDDENRKKKGRTYGLGGPERLERLERLCIMTKAA